jgi:hypothetical protein
LFTILLQESKNSGIAAFDIDKLGDQVVHIFEDHPIIEVYITMNVIGIYNLNPGE